MVLDLSQLAIFVHAHEIKIPFFLNKDQPGDTNLAPVHTSDINSGVQRLFSIWQSRLGTFLRYGLTVALLVFLASRVEWHQLAGLQKLDWSLAWLAVLLAGAAYPLQAWRWQLMLATQGLTPPTRWLHGAFWVGLFYNAFLPGNVAGDAIRFGYLWQLAPTRKAAAAASLVADRLLGLTSMCILAAGALSLQFSHDAPTKQLQGVLAISAGTTVLMIAGGWLFTLTRVWSPLCTRLLGPSRTATLQEVATALGNHRATLVAASLLSVSSWVLDFTAIWLLALCVGLPVSLQIMTVAAAAAYVVASLPLSIGGHGLREGALVAVLGWLGFSSATHPAVALLAAAFLAVTISWSLVGGLVYASSLLLRWPFDGHFLLPGHKANGDRSR